MVSDILQAFGKMDKKTKKEKKKKNRVKFGLSSPVDVMDSSTAALADSSKSPNSSKHRFPFVRRIFGNMLSLIWPGKSSSNKKKNSDTKTGTSSLPAVDRSSEEHPEVDLPAADQKTEPVTSIVEQIKLSPSLDNSLTSSDRSATELQHLQDMESLGIQPMANTQTSAPQWVSNLFGQQPETGQHRAMQGDDAGQAALGLPNLGNTCYMNSVLQCLLSVSPFHRDVLSQKEKLKNGATLLRALSDLQMSRLCGSDFNLKKNLAKVKGTIENHYPAFKGNKQQDAHEFLMACLSCLKEESDILMRSWPTFTCPVANLEFILKRERTCDSCGFQKSFTEDSNQLSLVIGPKARLTDSLQQSFNASSIECVCSHCSATKATETLKFLSFPQVLVLLVMRFDIKPSTIRKLKHGLEIPEELTVACVKESGKQTVSCMNSSADRRTQDRSFLQKILRKKKTVTTPQEGAPADIDAQYRLNGVVSHLGNNLFYGHYISHIRNPSEDGWLRCSDNFVRKASWSEVSKDTENNSYLLFYVKS